jgi:heme/copper-type cytochrome/quinol oxidase subunit 2
MVALQSPRLYVRPTLRMITVAALVINALSFLFDMLMVGPNEINITHLIVELVFAGIVALRFRWAPAIGALLGAALLIEGYVFISRELTEPANAANFAFAAVFFATSAVALVVGIAATVQNYRAPRSRPFVDPPAPGWTYPALLALTALKARDFHFDQPKITAKVGESVALRLENADTSTHYFEIDELNVHALMPPGESSLTLFTPTQPGVYRFYCGPHSDKETGEGMVGTLVVQ